MPIHIELLRLKKYFKSCLCASFEIHFELFFPDVDKRRLIKRDRTKQNKLHFLHHIPVHFQKKKAIHNHASHQHTYIHTASQSNTFLSSAMNHSTNSSNGAANDTAFGGAPHGSNNNSYSLPPIHPNNNTVSKRLRKDRSQFNALLAEHCSSSLFFSASKPQRGSRGCHPPDNVIHAGLPASSPIPSVVSGLPYPGSQASIASPHAPHSQYQYQQQLYAIASPNHFGFPNSVQSHGHSASLSIHPNDQEQDDFFQRESDSLMQKQALIQQRYQALEIFRSTINRIDAEYNQVYSDGEMKKVTDMSNDMYSQKCFEYAQESLSGHGEKQKRIDIADARNFLLKKQEENIFPKLISALRKKQTELQKVRAYKCLDAGKDIEVRKIMQKVDRKMKEINTTKGKCDETTNFLRKILVGQKIELSYVSGLIAGCLSFSDEVIRRITTTIVLFQYFYLGNPDDIFERVRFEMIDFCPVTDNNSVQHRAKEYLKNGITTPVADGILKFIYAIFLDRELVSPKAISFQEAVEENLKRASIANLIAYDDFFLASKNSHRPKRLVAWDKGNLETKCSCLAIILGFIKPGEQYLNFDFQTGFGQQPNGAERFGQTDKNRESEDLDATMGGDTSNDISAVRTNTKRPRMN